MIRKVNQINKFPSYRQFTKEVNKRIGNKEPFAIFYIDIDNLWAYNICYGFDKGDEVISLVGRIIMDTINDIGEEGDFTAYLGNDDFVIITEPMRIDPIGSKLIQRFEDESLSLYKEEDRHRGYLLTLDRKGRRIESQLMTLSMGVVTNVKRKIRHLAEANQIGAELIRYAKSFFGSNYVVDKRYSEEGLVPDEIIHREMKKRILIVDDDKDLSKIITDTLREDNYEVIVAASGRQALKDIEESNFNLVLLDIRLNGIDGLEILSAAKKKDPLIVVIIMTGFPTVDATIEAIRHDAYDFLAKPLDMEKLRLSIKRGLEHQRLELRNKDLIRSLTKQTLELNKKVEEVLNLNKGLQAIYVGTIATLAAAIDAKDHYTQGHSERVREFAVAIAKELKLPKQQIEMIDYACKLHDLGKIGIKDYILSKAGPLTQDERREINMHPSKGAEILRPLEYLKDAIPFIKHHHERYNGNGYPDGLTEGMIPIGARVIAVADSFDAMISERPYRPAMKIEEAVEEIKRCSGTQFDPGVVEAFLRILKKRGN